ncbi:AbfB domain-containing protein [Microbacterium sp. PMB16]|uniref:AbfB domain-containing protein n=1 Tax=Microbacterium sp. PMB16 TaxID=3120157 RepID=UPI003F4BD2DB
MFSLKSRRRARAVAAGIAAVLVSTVLVTVPVTSAAAADAPGYLVETGAYPDGASVGPANGLVLTDGNGGLRLVECGSVTNPVIVERTVDGRLSKVCFEAVFRPAVLNLEIESSFGVKAGAQPLEVTYSVAGGPEQEATVQPLKRGSVDVANTGESTIVVLEVQADPAVDVPATTTTHPRTAIAKIRTGLGSCTGTLVDRLWVLTAASCFAADPASLTAGAPAAPARVLFGPDAANDKTASGTGSLGVKITQLQPGAGKDAVLAKLATPVDDITPLPLATTAPTVGQDVAFTGFGRTNNVWVPLASRTNTYPVTAVAAANLTASASAAALCVGDGGAPGIRTIDGAKKIVAVASQSSQAGCYGSGIPAGTASVTSTRADVLAPWVATTIENGRKLPGIAAGQVLEIESVGRAGACISTKDRSSAAGPVIVPVGCAEIWQMRRWELVEVTPTVFALRSYGYRAMCAASADTAGTSVVQAACAPTDAKQQWTFREEVGGKPSIVNIASGKSLAAPTATTLTLKADTGAAAERWTYRNVTKARYDIAPLGSYVSLRTAVGGKSLSVASAMGTAAVTVVTATSPLAARQASTFRVVKGLANAECYSLESVAFPGRYLDFPATTDGGSRLVLAAASAASATPKATWCAEEAAHGTGFSFSAANNSWRLLRAHANGSVYAGASWYAGVPNADDTVNYVQDTAWLVGEPWAAPALADGQVLEIESAGQPGACLSTRNRSASAGSVLAPEGCTALWQMRRWELVEVAANQFAMRNDVTRTMCIGSADAAGSAAVQVACDLADSRQRWTFVGQSNGAFAIKNVASNKVLSAPTSTTIGLASASTAVDQQWRYRNVTKMRYDAAVVGNLVSLRTAVGGKSLVASGTAQATVAAISETSPIASRRDATFKVVQGLSDPGCFSFESLSSPGQYLDLTVAAAAIRLSTATTTEKKMSSTWCAQEAVHGVGVSFVGGNNSWRALRSYKNGFVYAGASWNAGAPEADDTVGYIPDTAWTVGAPWVTAP